MVAEKEKNPYRVATYSHRLGFVAINKHPPQHLLGYQLSITKEKRLTSKQEKSRSTETG
jgi:hypothetical protein